METKSIRMRDLVDEPPRRTNEDRWKLEDRFFGLAKIISRNLQEELTRGLSDVDRFVQDIANEAYQRGYRQAQEDQKFNQIIGKND